MTPWAAVAAVSLLVGSPPPSAYFGPAPRIFSIPKAADRRFSVVIEGAAFGSMPADARVGDRIEWDNHDIVDHTATSRDGGFDVVVPAGGRARIVLRRAGTFEVTCRYHPEMSARLTVRR